jgi:hypothetical protein
VEPALRLLDLFFWIRGAPRAGKKSSRENGIDHQRGQAKIGAARSADQRDLIATLGARKFVHSQANAVTAAAPGRFFLDKIE